MIMTFREQLVELDACYESLKWVGNKTIEEAWKTCENSEWMIWLLSKTDLDLIDPVCEITERVLHLVSEESQLACIWAISATRRRANIDELDAANAAAFSASFADYYRSCIGSNDDSCSVCYPVINVLSAACSAARSAAYTSAHCFVAAVYSAVDAAADDDDAENEERKKQCNILRKYFTIDQIKEALNKLVD